MASITRLKGLVENAGPQLLSKLDLKLKTQRCSVSLIYYFVLQSGFCNFKIFGYIIVVYMLCAFRVEKGIMNTDTILLH